MSESPKSRRRFLADLLFLGGAAGAAAFLAKSQLGEPTPAPAVSPTPTDCKLPAELSPPPGSAPVPPPQEAGNMVVPPPEEPKMLGDVEPPPPPRTPPSQPHIRGRMKISRPEPPSQGQSQ